jgi:transposase
LSLEALRHLERTVPAADRVRVLAVRLVAEGRPATEVGPLVGFTPEWVRTLVHRYNAEGPEALGDGRRHNAGAEPLLDPGQQVALRTALGGAAPDGGVWTCRWVAIWMSQQLGREVSPQRAWVWMRRLGFTPQRPRPRETHADAAVQDAWKKGGLPPSSP